MSFEILGSRILQPDFGNTVYIWGGLIGTFLSGLTVGYWAGGKLADRIATLQVFACLLAVPGFMLCCFPFYCGPVNDWIFNLELELRLQSLLASIILFFSPTVFLGAVSPYAVKLQIKNLAWIGTGVGNLYALSSLGSILGTLLTAFYLITAIGVRKIIFSEGIILLSAAMILTIAAKIQSSDEQPAQASNPGPVDGKDKDRRPSE